MKTIQSLPLLFFFLFFFSCQKEIDLGTPGNGGGGTPATPLTYPYYFTATINGAALKYEADDLNSLYSSGTSQPQNSLGFDDFDIYEGTIIANAVDLTKSSIYVHILKYFNHEPSNAERDGMIKTGNYAYGFGDVSSATVDGATIDYIDANGENWFSETGPQSGSSFAITELINNPNGTSAKIFKATFSCKLYNLEGTKSIQVTSATIRGKILSP
jgi:hypothetical protein